MRLLQLCVLAKATDGGKVVFSGYGIRSVVQKAGIVGSSPARCRLVQRLGRSESREGEAAVLCLRLKRGYVLR